MLALLKSLVQPYNKERLGAIQKRGKQLEGNVSSLPSQVLGKFNAGCGATFGIMEKCDFGCTACYLGKEANQQPPLSMAEIEKQLETLGEHLGPGGNVQITSGEVTLLKREDLAKICKMAVDRQLSPMVMTHGDHFLRDPTYLEHLMDHGNLQKISIHVDSTQRGRTTFKVSHCEKELNQLRDQFAEMICKLNIRKKNKLKAATTITVNHHNLAMIPDVLSWFFGSQSAFRMISFQPQADVGRTRSSEASGQAVWSKIESSLKRTLNPYPIHFGHPACTRMALFLQVATKNGAILFEAVRLNTRQDQRFMGSFLKDFRGILVNDRPIKECLAKILGVLLRKPSWILKIPIYGFTRSWQERQHIPAILKSILHGKLRIQPKVVVIHSFMGRDEVESEQGQERIRNCAFKVPMEGKMVSMCAFNAKDLRQTTYV